VDEFTRGIKLGVSFPLGKLCAKRAIRMELLERGVRFIGEGQESGPHGNLRGRVLRRICRTSDKKMSGGTAKRIEGPWGTREKARK